MSSRSECNQPEAPELAFITISDQESIKNPAHQQLARTQAIKHSLQRKRRQLQLTASNFVDETPDTIGRRRKRSVKENHKSVVEPPSCSTTLGASVINPFQTLTVDANRLTELLRHRSARHAAKPVSSVDDALDYQGLYNIFHSGLEDPALTAALCLTLALSANGGVMDGECSAYRLKCIRHINEKLSDPAQAASTTTVGAILLLVGVEGRLGERDTAQIHLDGTRQLLRVCDERKTHISHAVKRAVFWQDLFVAMIAGTRRVVSHELFPEMHWRRDPLQASLYIVPPGFAERAEILGLEFLDIIADICGLQALCQCDTNYSYNSLATEKIDNQQAWIESRLQQLSQQTTNPLVTCCIPAAYLCAYSFFAEVWCATVIPSCLCVHLLRALQQHETWDGWDDHATLLLWLLNVGVAFATKSSTQRGLAGLWHGSHRARLQAFSMSWDRVREQLDRFIWIPSFYETPCGAGYNGLQILHRD